MSDEDDGDNITRLPVGFKRPSGEDGKVLKVVGRWEAGDHCSHDYYFGGSRTIKQVTYLLRDGETEVECGRCHVRLDPMWVLKQLAHRETEYERKRATAQEEMQRLSERSRTQCDNCGKMTRISRAKAKRSA